MFSSNKPNYEKPATVISKDTVIETSSITTKTSIQVNGQVTGNVKTGDSLVVGESGSISGDTSAKYALIAGKVIGDVIVEQQLHLTKTGSVSGDITCKSIVVDDGASVNGKVMMDTKLVNIKDQKKENAS